MLFFCRKINVRLLACLIFFLITLLFLSFAEEKKTQTAGNLEEFIFKGKFSGKIRSYYMNRTFVSQDPQQSTALGAWINYISPSWNNVSFTLTGYTTQPILNNNPVYAGAGLLSNTQQGFSVLGRAFLEASFGKNKLRLFRQSMDTPFINTYDFRMIPVTLEAYTLEDNFSKKLNYIVSHVTKIKGWTNTGFQWMSDYAGFPGTAKPVTFAGINYNPSNTCKLQLWNYYGYDFMNIVCFQGDASWNTNADTRLFLSAQALDQQNTGTAIAGNFHTGMCGMLGGITWKGLGWTLAYNITSNNHDIVNPWGAYQGYSSLIEEDCDLAGERAWTTGFSYDFSNMGIKGLSFFTNHSRAYLKNSENLALPKQYEYNMTVDYFFSDSIKLRVRGAKITTAYDMGNLNFSDVRIILNYYF